MQSSIECRIHRRVGLCLFFFFGHILAREYSGERKIFNYPGKISALIIKALSIYTHRSLGEFQARSNITLYLCSVYSHSRWEKLGSLFLSWGKIQFAQLSLFTPRNSFGIVDILSTRSTRMCLKISWNNSYAKRVGSIICVQCWRGNDGSFIIEVSLKSGIRNRDEISD